MDERHLDALVQLRTKSEACKVMTGMCLEIAKRSIELDYPELPRSFVKQIEESIDKMQKMYRYFERVYNDILLPMEDELLRKHADLATRLELGVPEETEQPRRRSRRPRGSNRVSKPKKSSFNLAAMMNKKE